MSTGTHNNPILVLGGTGTVGSRIAKQLSASSIPALVASRKGTGENGVIFDWDDSDTWDNPFDKALASSTDNEEKEKNGIQSVYLIAPQSLNAASIMMEFVDFARKRGARRFVLQSASAIESGGPAMGKVHAYLRELGTRGEVEWAVLRPTWFQQTLAEQEAYVRSIRDESKLYSAAGDGKIPWVSADDVAAVAVQALTREDPSNTEFLILGPELLSYDDLAKMLSETLGRKIVHVDLSPSEFVKHQHSHGMPENYAQMLSSLDTNIKFGSENRTNDVILSLTGVSPRPMRQYMESVKTVWEPVSMEA